MIHLRRGVFAIACVGAHALVASDGHGEDVSTTCGYAYRDGQLAEKAGRFLEARTAYAACRRAVCPTQLVARCQERHERIESRIPTVVFVFRDAAGNDVPGVRVLHGDREITVAGSAVATPFDPGEYVLRFVRGPRHEERTQRVRIVEGEKNRRISVLFDGGSVSTPLPSASGISPALSSPSPLPDVPRAKPVPLSAFVLGGASLVSFALFATFAGIAYNDEQGLRSSCLPRCNQSDVDAVRTKYIVGDVFLGAGIVSLGLATYFFLARGTEPSGKPSITVDLGPTHSGAGARILGRF